MSRNDISEFLIHFTKGASWADAYERLKVIINEQLLVGSNRCIRGKYNCVCFSEAPLASLKDGLVNPDYYSRYTPFGVMVSKAWLFAQGGRPVIYQPDDEFSALPESHKWRHVRYEPTRDPSIDWQWEREWRVKTDELPFSPENAVIILPDESWAEHMLNEHEIQNDWIVQQYNSLLGDPLGEFYRDSFNWRIFVLN